MILNPIKMAKMEMKKNRRTLRWRRKKEGLKEKRSIFILEFRTRRNKAS